MGQKLIFLDLDGVLVTRRPGVFETHLLQNLKKVVEATGAKIVLSSDWRRHAPAREEARRALRSLGLDFIGTTPCLSAYIAQRPTEILQWKKEHCEKIRRENLEPVTSWIAIDDRLLLEERHGSALRGHFVHTNPVRGFCEQSAEEAIRLLQKEIAPTPTKDFYQGTKSATAPPAVGDHDAGPAVLTMRRRMAEQQLNGNAARAASVAGNRDMQDRMPRALLREIPKRLHGVMDDSLVDHRSLAAQRIHNRGGTPQGHITKRRSASVASGR